jgi:hypothetical protein
MIYIIYKTTNLINNKTYIGIHQTNNINDGYLGSGLAMEKAIKKYRKENFKREILEECNSYDELLEREKFYVDEKWVKDRMNYNLKTGGQSFGLLSKTSKEKISNTLKLKYASGELKQKPKSDEDKLKFSILLKNKYKNGEIKLKPKTEIEKQNQSNKLKKFYENNQHPTKGKTPWNKGKKNLQVGWCKGMKLGPKTLEEKEKVSKSLKEYYKINTHPTKGLSSWNKGKKMEKVVCPYCNKLSDIANGKRWHFENCKFK